MLQNSLNSRIVVAMGDVVQRFAETRSMRAISEGLINLVPIVLICSICIVITNLPIPAFQAMLNDVTAGSWVLMRQIIVRGLVNIVALAAMLSVSLAIVEQSELGQNREISVFIPLFTTTVCYVIFFVWNQAGYFAAPETLLTNDLFSHSGRRGVAFGLLMALVATNLFIAFDKLWHRLRGSRRRIVDSTHQLRVAMRSLFPMIMTVAVFLVLRLLLNRLHGSSQFVDNTFGFMARTVNEGGFGSVLLSVVMMQVLGFFGAYGTDDIQSFLAPEYISYFDIPTAASSGLTGNAALLHGTVVNVDFYGNFVELGGSGATLGLLLALFIFGTVARGRQVARLSVFPAAFNVNETLLYGAPVVLNPFMLVPFILAPTLVAAVSYGAFALGLVPPIATTTDWTMPILFSGYLSTGSVAGVLLQIVGLGIAFAVYAPFVLITRNAIERHQQAIYGQFKKAAAQAANNEQTQLMGRRDAIGTLTRDFIAEIHEFFDNKQLPFFMVFQPKTDSEGKVAGAESLLRWTHPRFGPVPPNIVIELTDEAGVTTEFGRWITRASLEEFARWRSHGIEGVLLSINLNPHHISIDEEFPEFLDRELTRLNIDRSLIELEITEHVAVDSGMETRQMFKRLRALGVGLSIDDMGIGYSSLTYISDFGAETVKIDISLIDKVDTDYQQQTIVRSVVELADSLDLTVIVEGVETREQVDTLVSLGCRFFQGYYYSKPLLPADFIGFVAQHGEARLLRK